MSIESEFKKNDITVIDRLDTLSINSLAKSVASKLSKAFPNQNLSYRNLFIEISRIPMYIANMPEGIAEAFYCSKNSSIYFKDGTPLDELEKSATHEIIHYLQEIKDKKGKLKRLGLCDLTGVNPYGLALNEGAVQLAASKSDKQSPEMVKYYDITFSTISPSYYPLLCNLVSQLVYISDEDLFYDSLFFGTTEYHKELIYLLGERNFFAIQDKLDDLLNIEEEIIKTNLKLFAPECTTKQAFKYGKIIEKCKKNIKKCFFDIQSLIFTSYFNKEFSKLNTTAEIEDYRCRLYNYKNLIGITDGYTQFNDFYVHKMEQLEEKYEKIINNVALVPLNNSKIFTLFKSIKKIFGLNKEKEYNN